MIQYNTIQYNTIQYNAMQCNTIQYNAIHIQSRSWHQAGRANHINELAWKSVVRGDLYESPYLAKATPFMDSHKAQCSRLLISSKQIDFSQLYYLNSQLASLFH